MMVSCTDHRHAITLTDVMDAQKALAGVVVQTPLLENPDANAHLGGRLLIKAENMQRTGAFKIRGAYNCIRQLTAAELARGVLTYSSGNHAQGVALAARLLGTNALIVMPDDVPAAKVKATRALGATIVTFARDTEQSDDVVEQLRADTGRIIVPPSADPRVLAGAGTVAVEMFNQAAGRDAVLDAVLLPCGGGGLAASTAIVAHALSPETQVFAVEPNLFDDTRRSLLAGRRLDNPKGQRTICDAIMTPRPNALTFPINLDLLAGGLVASDAETRAAMQFAFEHYRIVLEPGAAVGIAAVLNGQIDIKGKAIATVVTGGNIDAARFCGLLAPSGESGAA
jgi:threo-3-hydroxy-L-aspartate ammonia-lyase